MSGCPNVGRMCNCTGACLPGSTVGVVEALVGVVPDSSVMSVQAELDAVTRERDNLALERDRLEEKLGEAATHVEDLQERLIDANERVTRTSIESSMWHSRYRAACYAARQAGWRGAL